MFSSSTERWHYSFRRVRGYSIREDIPAWPSGYSDLVVIASARRAGDPGSISGPGDDLFSLIISIRSTRWLFLKLNFHQNLPVYGVNIKTPK